ncbi:hypothetical protein GCM10018963_68480 [Saccharothrix longispora]
MRVRRRRTHRRRDPGRAQAGQEPAPRHGEGTVVAVVAPTPPDLLVVVVVVAVVVVRHAGDSDLT